MSRRLLPTLIAFLVLAAPAVAPAQEGTNAPPGLSAADQYLETVPSSGGNTSVGNGQKPSLDDPTVQKDAATALPSGTTGALAKSGPTGRSAAALAAQTTPPLGERIDPGPAAPTTALGEGSNPLAAVTKVATGGAGLGVLFPLLIVAGTLIVAGGALQRRRRT